MGYSKLPRQHPPHNRLHQPLAVRLRARKSGFEGIVEGHELVYFYKLFNNSSAVFGFIILILPYSLRGCLNIPPQMLEI